MLTVIGVFKLFKAVSLLFVAFLARRLLHHDVAETVTRWVLELHADPHSRHLRWLLSKTLSVNDKRLRELYVATFIYAGIFATEGIGLLLQKRWAEYFTIISTGLLVPLEIYELFHRPSVLKGVVLLANVAIVVYLIARLRKPRSASNGAIPG